MKLTELMAAHQRAPGEEERILRSWHVRLIVVVLVAFQSLQGARVGAGGFVKSYWLVDYSDGFVRRGLLGEVLRIAVGGSPSDQQVRLALWLTAAIGVAALAVVTEQLIRTDTRSARWLAIIIAASPFSFDYVVAQRRPDQIGVVLLVILGLVLLHRPDSRRAFQVMGLLFALGVLQHESVLLYAMPMALLMTACMTSAQVAPDAFMRIFNRRAIELTAPSVAVAGFVFAFGRASGSLESSLRSDVTFPLNDRLTMFDFLGDSLGGSMRNVAHMTFAAQCSSLLVGAVMLALTFFCIRRCVDLKPIGTPLPSRRLFTVLVTLVIVGELAQFALGIDWFRWTATIGCTSLIGLAFVLIASERTHVHAATSGIPGRMSNFGALIIAGLLLYLVLLPPVKQYLWGFNDIRPTLILERHPALFPTYR